MKTKFTYGKTYQFKGIDDNGNPIPYQPGEKREKIKYQVSSIDGDTLTIRGINEK